MSGMASEADQTSAGDRLGFLLARHGRIMNLRLRHALGVTGLRPQHGSTLLRLARLGSTSQQQLIEALAIDPSSLVSILNDLERDGLALRSRDPADRRRHNVEITPLGRKAACAVENAIAEVERDTFAPLDRAEVSQLHALLGRLQTQSGDGICASPARVRHPPMPRASSGWARPISMREPFTCWSADAWTICVGCVDRGLSDRGWRARGRARRLDLGHLRPPARPRQRRPDRRRRLRPLPPLPRRRRPDGRTRRRRIPVLNRLAAHPADRAGGRQPGRAGLLRPTGRHAAVQPDRPGGHAVPLGPAAGVAGRWRLVQPGHRGPVRRLRRSRGGRLGRPGQAMDHAE